MGKKDTSYWYNISDINPNRYDIYGGDEGCIVARDVIWELVEPIVEFLKMRRKQNKKGNL